MMTFRSTICVIFALLLLGCAAETPADDSTGGANKYLWNASLDTVSFLPLEEADRVSGLIVTGWGSVEGSSQVYRMTVLVSEPNLDATALKVAVFRRSGSREIPAAREKVIEVENAILSRARELRIRDVRG